MTFKRFFQVYGNQLFDAYHLAQTDGSDETFIQWVLGEYDYYLSAVRNKEDAIVSYEVPYAKDKTQLIIVKAAA